MELKPDLVIADRFRLVRPLGEGGMGAVWLAHHIRLQVPCAVKFMRPEVAEHASVRARFDREAVAAAQLRSPHVVQILDHGVWEGSPYIAMECLEGEDLDQRLRRRGKLSPEETLAVVAQVARALSKAHAAGLVHRDLKPPNIFLTKDDDREIVKVLDFGVAKVTSPDAKGATKTGSLVGTPFYMSPEQAQGTKSVDLRTDLWALGVVTYQCLTGALPFESDAFGNLVIKICIEPIPVPSQVAPVPPGFDAWFARAVQRDQALRFQTAKELADALADALGLRGAAIEGLGRPGMSGASDPPPPLVPPITPVNMPVPARSLDAGAVSAAASPGDRAPAERSRTLLTAGLAMAALLGGGAFFALRGGGTTSGEGVLVTPARSAPPAPPAPPPASAPAPPASSPSPAPSATQAASAAPEHTTAPTADAAAPTASATAPAASAVPAKVAPPAVVKHGTGKQPRDIGF